MNGGKLNSESSLSAIENRIRTVVVDDNPRARESICKFAGNHGKVLIVGDAENGRDAMAMIAALQPDLVLTDLWMPELDGHELAANVRKLYPDTRVIVISLDDSPEAQVACRANGAHGFVHKERLLDELPRLINRIFPD